LHNSLRNRSPPSHKHLGLPSLVRLLPQHRDRQSIDLDLPSRVYVLGEREREEREPWWEGGRRLRREVRERESRRAGLADSGDRR